MMKFKVLFLIGSISLLSFSASAQRGVRVGYIDTEYILQNVPEYQQASAQLDQKVQGWKTEIETKLNAIAQKKKELDNERVLLTKELYNERFEDITFEEAEVLAYQQERFGPEGDLMIQKRQLIEPIQDQIFAAVQEIAETKKYDYVIDKSADVVVLYAAERYDMSEQVLRTITRTSKRSQAKNKKERKELEDEQVIPIVSADKDDRQKALEDRKAKREEQLAAQRAEREKAAEEQRKAREELRDAKKQEAVARREKAIADRNKKSNPSDETIENSDDAPISEENPANSERAKRAKAAEDRKNAEAEIRAAKKQEATARREKALAARNKNSRPPGADVTPLEKDTTSKAKLAVKSDSTKLKSAVKKDTTDTEKPKTAVEIAEAARLKKLKDREARQKALQDRKKKILEERKKARAEREKQIKRLDSIAKAKKNEENN
ncbi:MAG: OmpH family outer membrane protein [Winogradskyella sp.]|uniref:OmpH family outer membrane protein n=1 Tax=Winogradskyella sp. TaxID=1883156 RepID=UPI00385E58C2